MKNNKGITDIFSRPWYIRRLRGGSARHPEWAIELDEDDDPHSESIQVAMVYGPEELALAFCAIPQMTSAAAMAAFRIQMVLENAPGVLEGHRTGLKEALRMLMDALEEVGQIKTTLHEKLKSST